MKQGVSANELWTQVPLANRTVTAASVVNSIQRGTINHSSGGTTTTATISSVDTAKSHCSYLGTRTEEGNLNKALATVYLTNSTTVSCQLASTPDGSSGRTNYEVVEYT